MIKTYKTEGIVLTRKNRGEADKLITLFTKQFGKKTVLAKGIRRVTSRRAAHLEPFSHVTLLVHPSKGWDIVSEATTVSSFSVIRQKLERVGFVYIALELTEKLTAEEQESYFVYENLVTFLHAVNDPAATRNGVRQALFQFKVDLLGELGFIRRDETYAEEKVDNVIEELLEHRIKSTHLLTRIQRGL